MLRSFRSPRWAKAISFRSLLLFPFLGQVILVIGLTGYFNVRNSQRSAEVVAWDRQIDAGKRIEQHLDAYLSLPHRLTALNHQAIQQGLLQPNNLKPFERFFVTQMQQFPEVGHFNFGMPSGDYIGVERRDGELLIIEVSVKSNESTLRSFRLNHQGDREKIFEVQPFPDGIRKEAWFADALQRQKPIWTRVYQWEDKPEVLSIAASHPLYDAEKRVIGVVGVDLMLTQISEFLRSLQLTANTRAFILERDGALIGTSTPMPIYQADKDQIKRLNATEVADPLIRASAQAIQQRSGSFAQVQTTQQLNFSLQGQAQMAYVLPWHDRYGLDWVVVIAAPMSDFNGAVMANIQATLWMTAAALTIAAGIGLISARWGSRSIAHFTHWAQTLSQSARQQFRDGMPHLGVRSPVQELNVLSDSFQDMALQLRDSFQALAAVNDDLEARVEARTIDLSAALNQLQATQVQMLQAEKMSSLGQMVAGVAHEINKPINFIHANLTYTADYTGLLLEVVRLYQLEHRTPLARLEDYLAAIDFPFLQSDLPKLVRLMQNGSERVREIVNGLRTFSRLDEAVIKTVNLQESLDSAILLLQHRLVPEAQLPTITIEKRYIDTPSVECYAGQLNQVFFHILNNAIDAILAHYQQAVAEFQPYRPGVITMTTQMAAPEVIGISIRDNGIGMDAAVQAKMFDPFFTTKMIGRGMGLSLSIDYQVIVEQHGGLLTCTSSPCMGTEMLIQIPLQQG